MSWFALIKVFGTFTLMLTSAVSISSTSSASLALVVSITPSWSKWVQSLVNLAESSVSERARLIGDHSQAALLNIVKDVHAHGKWPGDGSSDGIGQESWNSDSECFVPLELLRVKTDGGVGITVLIVSKASGVSTTHIAEKVIRISASGSSARPSAILLLSVIVPVDEPVDSVGWGFVKRGTVVNLRGKLVTVVGIDRGAHGLDSWSALSPYLVEEEVIVHILY